jgi:hypothetical protein
MKILSNSYKKYFAAVATAFAAIAIPAQATDCTTICQNAAATAAQNAVNQALPSVTAQCAAINSNYIYMNSCVGTQLTNIGNTTYAQVLAQCTGSCH